MKKTEFKKLQIQATKMVKAYKKLHEPNEQDLADKIGIARNTLRTRLKDGNWHRLEVYFILKELDI